MPVYFSILVACAVWAALLLAMGLQGAIDAVAGHWEVSLTMVFGSFIAGATAEGGGAVAFPVFTKLLGIPPEEARVFSLAIQSVGMTAASLMIVASRTAVDWRAVRWTALGGAAGLLIGIWLLAPMLTGKMVRLIFTMMLASFGWVLYRLQRETPRNPRLPAWGRRERSTLLLCGLAGGVLSALVGTGADILFFSLMVVYFRVSEKVATPSSVVLMAFLSLVGFAAHGAAGGFTEAVRDYWLAAVPVVVVGAPLGAWVCTRMSRHAIAWFLLALIALEVATTLALIPLSPAQAAFSLAAFTLFGLIYRWLHRNAHPVIA